ncbi:MAG: tRNA dimethylallyltransferase [Candidatus Wolfebacteria bacterium GW2011_GWE2_44_13]|uniref:tRNA dimethylallyltransferase n=1 Tax=Candidatus Wolfebacteria bacterium GW2011_GWE2_44_13 TaxID=1619017 RepID=A0A0G1JG62_9BACT|nr:MAG: tRNA dimethylallyltransferase [Candidatus Wolfebacteria bacterium GW2011_GWE2_44_13]
MDNRVKFARGEPRGKTLFALYYFMHKPKLIVILGPTASGKSDLAVAIARFIAHQKLATGAEVISADSRQVYTGLDIGSGKITQKEMRAIPHHLLNVASPKRTFTVTQYQRLAKKAIRTITKENRIPILCGGTGLYIDAITHNYILPAVPPQPLLRKELELQSTEMLFAQLEQLDPHRARTIDRHNRRRLIRALEIVLITHSPVPELKASSPYDLLTIGITRTQEEIASLIEKRLHKRIKAGMLIEVERLHANGLSWKRLDDLGLEYRWVSRFLRGLISKELLLEKILLESIQYAKRQMTWFKRDKTIHWITSEAEALQLVKNFLTQ